MNLEEIREDLERNRKERLKFIIWYAQWVRRTPNSVWSKQQKEMIESVLIPADRIIQKGIVVK
ncbi:MAG: hypothetical protein QGH39_00750 [Candidatus Thermoplasmatota archaeon]|jgi:hypothetical protein|nr:hypothetical protein [Candidatus Thermoplasmatota archaeon]MDP7264071.1 hypothetical protein [Candidatus Thermoplasmatota archaeon]